MTMKALQINLQMSRERPAISVCSPGKEDDTL